MARPFPVAVRVAGGDPPAEVPLEARLEAAAAPLRHLTEDGVRRSFGRIPARASSRPRSASARNAWIMSARSCTSMPAACS